MLRMVESKKEEDEFRGRRRKKELSQLRRMEIFATKKKKENKEEKVESHFRRGPALYIHYSHLYSDPAIAIERMHMKESYR